MKNVDNINKKDPDKKTILKQMYLYKIFMFVAIAFSVVGFTAAAILGLKIVQKNNDMGAATQREISMVIKAEIDESAKDAVPNGLNFQTYKKTKEDKSWNGSYLLNYIVDKKIDIKFNSSSFVESVGNVNAPALGDKYYWSIYSYTDDEAIENSEPYPNSEFQTTMGIKDLILKQANVFIFKLFKFY